MELTNGGRLMYRAGLCCSNHLQEAQKREKLFQSPRSQKSWSPQLMNPIKGKQEKANKGQFQFNSIVEERNLGLWI